MRPRRRKRIVVNREKLRRGLAAARQDTVDRRIVERRRREDELRNSIAAAHEEGTCGYLSSLLPACESPSISDDRPFCMKHQDVTCAGRRCESQAVTDVDAVGYMWVPACFEHMHTIGNSYGS